MTILQYGASGIAAATKRSLYIEPNSEHCSYSPLPRAAVEPSHHVALPHPTIVHRRQFRARLPPVEPAAAPRHARRCSVRKSNVDAIDATLARWRGGVHPTHWLICAQVLLSSEADEDADEAPVAADPPAPAAAADGGGVDGKLIVQGAAVAAMGAALYFLNTLPGPTSGWAAK